MRSNGVEEKYITGDATDREKFQKWAETLELAIGNPLYHWSHLELRKYFGYEGYLCGQTADQVWELCKEKLSHSDMSARNLILQSNVKMLCTTDDPVDSLEWHRKLREEKFEVKVLPTFRPDRAMALEKEDYLQYIDQLSRVSGLRISSFSTLIEALIRRMDFFDQNGCLVSDHGLEYIMYQPYTMEEVEQIMARRLEGKTLTAEQVAKFKTAFMLAVGK